MDLSVCLLFFFLCQNQVSPTSHQFLICLLIMFLILYPYHISCLFSIMSVFVYVYLTCALLISLLGVCTNLNTLIILLRIFVFYCLIFLSLQNIMFCFIPKQFTVINHTNVTRDRSLVCCR